MFKSILSVVGLFIYDPVWLCRTDIFYVQNNVIQHLYLRFCVDQWMFWFYKVACFLAIFISVVGHSSGNMIRSRSPSVPQLNEPTNALICMNLITNTHFMNYELQLSLLWPSPMIEVSSISSLNLRLRRYLLLMARGVADIFSFYNLIVSVHNKYVINKVPNNADSLRFIHQLLLSSCKVYW